MKKSAWRCAIAMLGLFAAVMLFPQASLASSNCLLLQTVTVSTNGGVNFSPYNPLAGNAEVQQGTITVSASCTVGLIVLSNYTLGYTIALSPGQSGTAGSRYMTVAGSNDHLHYNLFTDINHSIVWGDGTGNSQTKSNTLQAPCTLVLCEGQQNNPVYGRIPAASASFNNVDPGTYSDSIIVTVTY